MKWFLIVTVFLFLQATRLTAQVVQADTIVKSRSVSATDQGEFEPNSAFADSLRHRKIRRTILRATFLPGWGQVTNKQIWKVPLVATVITIPAVLFVTNLKQYKALRDAYINRRDGDDTNNDKIPLEYQPLSDNSIKFYRDSYRQNVDYSALVFVVAWGLNVVDAAVFANLKDFDVSDKLSLKLKPSVNFYGQSSIGLVLTFKDQSKSKRYIPK